MTAALQALLCATSLSSGGASVSITNRTVSNTGTGSGTITATYKLDNDGNAYKTTTATTLLEQWLNSGAAGDYEVRATKISGDTPTGTALGSWLALSTDRLWTLSAGAGLTKTCKLTVEIRDVATATVQDSATITITANNSGSGGGGGGGGTVSISDQGISQTGNPDGTTISISYKLDNDGNVYAVGADGLLEAWLDSGLAGDFEARATHISGDTIAGTMGTWLVLSTDRSWTLSAAAGAIKSGLIKIEIRDASSLTVLDSANISLTVDNNI